MTHPIRLLRGKARPAFVGYVEHQLDRSTSDHLAQAALVNDWTVNRKTATYFTANRNRGGVSVQVAVAVIDGRLKATRLEITDETNVSDRVVDWLKGAN